MKIVLRKLTLTNFKGIRHQSIRFVKETKIYGANATGKSTLMDSFLWLFFGKDSSDRKDFEIKTLDANNQPYRRLDHEVEAVIDVDGNEITIRRQYKEKWSTKRGEATPMFIGHETNFFWNDVPMKESEYQAKISKIIPETIFKLLTNTTHFNSIKWQERRGVLLELAGTISNNDVLERIMKPDNRDSFLPLMAALNQQKSTDEYKRELGSKKKKIKDELERIPIRIQEANRSMPPLLNYEQIESDIQSNNVELESIDKRLTSLSEDDRAIQAEITAKIKEVGSLKNRNLQIESEKKSVVVDNTRNREANIRDKKSDLRRKQDELSRLRIEYGNDEKRLKGQEELKTLLTAKWTEINGEKLEFKEGEFCCPACKREYEASDIDQKKAEMLANFNTEKSRRLEDINQKGKAAADEIAAYKTRLSNLQASGETLKAEVQLLTTTIVELENEHARLSLSEDQQVQDAILFDTEFIANNEKIKLLNEEIDAPRNKADNESLVTRRKDLIYNIMSLRQQLATKSTRDNVAARIAELSEQESSMAQELADLEKWEFAVDQFVKEKMDTLESRVNGRFKIVQFKMFEDQINGGRSEACTTLINGVPYSDANTAAKIQAGIDIINVLSDHFNITAPIWVDNRESVINIPYTECQIINLFVSEKDDKIRVVTEESEMATA